MPFSDPDPQDPHSLVGVAIPESEDCHLDMAYVLAEEFVRLGYEQEQILTFFRNPFYRSAHLSLRVLGEERIQLIVHEASEVWGRFQVIAEEPGTPSLTHLEGVLPEEERGRP